MNKVFLIVIILLISAACHTKMDAETYSGYQKQGNEVTNMAQATLLSNVGSAIQTGGPEYAVEFCNLKASGIVDSLNLVYNCLISRVSEKIRNPENRLKTQMDHQLWNTFKHNSQMDTVVVENNKIVYYKRINTAMPACLKCHGTPGSDIDAGTSEKLKRLYPDDLATGYQLNEFRGFWKVEL